MLLFAFLIIIITFFMMMLMLIRIFVFLGFVLIVILIIIVTFNNTLHLGILVSAGIRTFHSRIISRRFIIFRHICNQRLTLSNKSGLFRIRSSNTLNLGKQSFLTKDFIFTFRIQFRIIQIIILTNFITSGINTELSNSSFKSFLASFEFTSIILINIITRIIQIILFIIDIIVTIQNGSDIFRAQLDISSFLQSKFEIRFQNELHVIIIFSKRILHRILQAIQQTHYENLLSFKMRQMFFI